VRHGVLSVNRFCSDASSSPVAVTARWPRHGSTVDPKYRLSPGAGSELEPALGPQPAEIAALSKS
jgi:hypothetical protein